MNCETGFLHSVGFWSVPVRRSVCLLRIRGKLAIGGAPSCYRFVPADAWKQTQKPRKIAFSAAANRHLRLKLANLIR
jgi:hypothetical protein